MTTMRRGTVVPGGLQAAVVYHGSIYVFHDPNFYSRKHARNGRGSHHRRLQKTLVKVRWLSCLHVGCDNHSRNLQVLEGVIGHVLAHQFPQSFVGKEVTST